MPTDVTETIESFAFEGLLSAGVAIALAVALAALAAWLLWRERPLLGNRWATAFWALRVVAIAVLFWMLAGPTNLTIQRLTQPQSIAVLVDASGSMDVVDPQIATEDLRWMLAASNETSAVAMCDRAVVALATASAASDEAFAGVSEHRPLREVENTVAAAEQSATRSAELLKQVVELIGRQNDPLADRAERIIALVEGPIRDAGQAFQGEAAASDTQASPLTEAAASYAELLRGARRRSSSLARDMARWRAESGTPSGGFAADGARRERVAALLAALEQGPLKSLAPDCRIRRLRFDQSVSVRETSETDLSQASSSRPTPVAYDPRSATDDAYETEAVLGTNDPTQAATDLSAALEQVEKLRAEESLRMAILITDGRHNAYESSSPQDVATRLSDVPVHVVPVGVSKPVRDLLIHRVEAPSAVVLRDTAAIEVLVTAFDCEGEQIEVTLRQEGEEIDRQTFSVSRERSDHEVIFRVAAEEVGLKQYEIEVEPVSDEASLTNNLSAAAFEVVRDKLRVLLADRAPRYEYRYLQQLFRRDEHVDFDEFLTLPELHATGSRRATATLPVTEEEWSEYDVVLLGDLGPEHLTADRQRSLLDYVRQGGNVILVAGKEHMPGAFVRGPLAELSPVEEGPPVDPRAGYAVGMTEEARLVSAVQIRDSAAESQMAWESTFRLAPIYGLSRFNRAKPTTQTLLEAIPLQSSSRFDRDAPSLFCWAPIGAGRVAYLAAPQSYLLRFRRGDRDHHRFWGQTLRWITAATVGSGTDRVRIETDRNSYDRGQPVEVTVWLNDQRGRPVLDAEFAAAARSLDAAVAQVGMRPDGDVPGRYVGVFDRLPIGAYEIVPTGELIDELTRSSTAESESTASDAISAVSTLITVQAAGNVEQLNTQSNRPLLEQIAELTGGQVLPPTAVAEVLRLESLSPEVSETTQRTSLWNRWSYLFIVLGCLFTEWAVRKQKGLA
ncbi:MAG: hypothetical protein AAGF31_05395 [Planctomycetota bacterium]